MPTMDTRPACLVFTAVLVTGCAGSRLPQTGFGRNRKPERVVMSYYERHATE
jgi:hypothetical protein